MNLRQAGIGEVLGHGQGILVAQQLKRGFASLLGWPHVGGTQQWQSWCSQQCQVQPHTQMYTAACQSMMLRAPATLPWCSCC